MPIRVTTVLACAIGMIAISSFSSAVAGPLNPPAGPIASTPGPEPRTAIDLVNTPGDADSFFRITSSGSYYLPKSFAFSAGEITGMSGIEVDADNVTIDLNGFTLKGDAAGLNAIRINLTRRGTIIRNGHLNTWGRGGVVGEGTTETIVEDLDIRAVGLGASAQPAVIVNAGSTLRNIVVNQVGTAGSPQVGVQAGAGSIIDHVTVNDATATGILGGTGSVVINCAAVSAGGAGISVSSGGHIQGCTATQCGGDGINGDSSGIGACVIDCNSRSNVGAGIAVGEGALVQGCTAFSNGGSGVQTAGRTRVIGCTARFNTQHGFQLGDWAVISGCQATLNGLDGINFAGGGGQVADCTCTTNTDDGIEVGADVTVRGCACDSNSQAGIHVGNASDARIDGNTCTDNARGIDVDGPGNIIVRNMCSGNITNFDIVASNVVGIVVPAPLSGPVIGSGGGAGVGTTDPTANHVY